MMLKNLREDVLDFLCFNFLNQTTNNMKTIYILLLTLLVGNATMAAEKTKQCTISGVILDEQNKPVDYVTVGLFKVSDSSLVKTALTTPDGRFEFISINPGNYYIKAT